MAASIAVGLSIAATSAASTDRASLLAEPIGNPSTFQLVTKEPAGDWNTDPDRIGSFTSSEGSSFHKDRPVVYRATIGNGVLEANQGYRAIVKPILTGPADDEVFNHLLFTVEVEGDPEPLATRVDAAAFNAAGHTIAFDEDSSRTLVVTVLLSPTAPYTIDGKATTAGLRLEGVTTP